MSVDALCGAGGGGQDTDGQPAGTAQRAVSCSFTRESAGLSFRKRWNRVAAELDLCYVMRQPRVDELRF